VGESSVLVPDPEMAASYQEQVERYKQLRSAAVQC